MKYNSELIQSNIEEVFDQCTLRDIREGKDWYPEHNLLCTNIATENDTTPMQVMGVFSALSPQKRLEENIKLVKEFYRWKHQTYGWRKVGHYIRQKEKARNIHRMSPDKKNILTELGGMKTQHFFRSLLDNNDLEACCLDTHMITLTTGETKDKFTHKQYHFVKEEVKKFAKFVNLTPVDLQSTLWLKWRKIKKF